MDPYQYLPPERRPGRHDFSLLFIFFLTIVLMGGVAAFLTAGWAWKPPEMPTLLQVQTRSSNLFGTGPVDQTGSPAPTPSSPNSAAASKPSPIPTSTTAP